MKPNLRHAARCAAMAVVLACAGMALVVLSGASPAQAAGYEKNANSAGALTAASTPVPPNQGSAASAPSGTRPPKPTKTRTPSPTPTTTVTPSPTATVPPPTPPVGVTAFYVSPGGSDSNPGTADLPWKTIQHAADTLTAGQMVFIAPGTYNEQVKPKNSGDATNGYIAYAGYPNSTVTLDGTRLSVPTYGGLFDMSSKSYIKVTGLLVTNSSGVGIFADSGDHLLIQGNHTYKNGGSGIGMWYSSNITVDGNNVEDSNSGGSQESITIGVTGPFEVKNNEVHNELRGYNKEGIDAKQGAHDGSIHHNVVHHTQAVAIYVDAYDADTGNIDVYDNVVHDASSGYIIASEMGGLLHDVRHYNNIAYGITNCGIRVFGDVAGYTVHPMTNVTIINNTVYNSGCGIDESNSQLNGPMVIRNNILSQNRTQLAINVSSPNLTVDYNLLDSSVPATCTNCIQGAPAFASAAAADFHLLAGSAAIDAGSPDLTLAPAVDFDGKTRVTSGDPRIDIGAYER